MLLLNQVIVVYNNSYRLKVLVVKLHTQVILIKGFSRGLCSHWSPITYDIVWHSYVYKLYIASYWHCVYSYWLEY